MAAPDVASRPAQLDGCWKTWNEEDVDVMLRTNTESEALHLRRRFTSRARLAQVSVTLPAEKYAIFRDWWLINQQQGLRSTWVKTPYGDEEAWLWIAPPKISWNDAKAFTATVSMYRGPDF